ncbi:putative quinol monooxygenase [Agrococcus sp. TF02-05]|uniref:putative quinol monooxygenase n=1 Tax=Agrococcus sp. TF02-05 TaxID=2815211 RepID=UPI001AA1CABA|nr:putative quinol monooxygenase [Agrococcus sp. TF02-05]MBO1769306.1 antibiotic biosynthesis monooxygenase [Agrococcus sp. TF02-05]
MTEHFVAIATYTAKPDAADRVAQLLPTLAAESRQEPGNISYSIARDLERPNVFTIVEVYDDADAFAAHRESAHFASIGRMQIIPMLESREVVGYSGDGALD